MNFVACLGGNKTVPVGVCSPNYGGPLCSVCLNGFYSTGADHLCLECPNPGYVYVIIIISGLLIALVSMFLTTVNSRYAKYNLNYTPAVVKIWIMHT